MIKHLKKIIGTIVVFYMSSFSLYAQAPNTTNLTGTQIFLLTIAIVLLVPLYILGRTFMASVKIYHDSKNKKQSNIIPTVILLAAIFLSSTVGAQNEAIVEVAATSPSRPNDWGSIILFITILTELLVILYLSTASLKFIKAANTPDEETEIVAAESQPTIWSKLVQKYKMLKPLKDVEVANTGHNYDGINELDNNIPGWFTAAFVVCILFAGTYLLRYHVFHSAPLMIEEYTLEMADAEKEKAAYMEQHANIIDENNVQMLAAADIESGKILYGKNCAVCHVADGGGATGPNLTDEYWIHGGAMNNIFKTIKYGWPDKGMIAWKDNFSDKQIVQLASFVKLLKGTKPAAPKEPQGDIFKEDAQPSLDSVNTGISDSSTVKMQ